MTDNNFYSFIIARFDRTHPDSEFIKERHQESLNEDVSIEYTENSTIRFHLYPLTGIQMQSIQLKTHVSADGFVEVQMPPEFKNLPIELMLVFQPLQSPLATTVMYPADRFYGACDLDEMAIDDNGIDPTLDDDLDLITGVARS